MLPPPKQRQPKTHLPMRFQWPLGTIPWCSVTVANHASVIDALHVAIQLIRHRIRHRISLDFDRVYISSDIIFVEAPATAPAA